MAPSAGHLHKLVVRNLKILKTAWHQTQHLIQSKIPVALRPVEGQLVKVPVRQPLHPVAYLRQSQSRWYSTRSTYNSAVRRFTTASEHATPGLKYNRASFPKSRVGAIVNSLPGRAPFAHTLRPNLTGGALSRSAGGYGLGSGRVGGARYFSHTPAAPAQVIQNVSQAVRAFCLSGQKAQYDGRSPRSGEKRYRAVSSLQDDTTRKILSLPKATPGSFIEFTVNPTITALTPLSVVAGYSNPTSSSADPAKAYLLQNTLNTDGLLDILSVDFSRALTDLSAVLADLSRLAALGDLPISFHAPASLRVHFPGCDGDTVERLCCEIGVRRGIVIQDAAFDAFVGAEIALLFPFASSDSESSEDDAAAWFERRQPQNAAMVDWEAMLSPPRTVSLPSDEFSTRSDTGLDVLEDDPWSSPWGYESLQAPSDDEVWHPRGDPLEYQGFEGIYRFMEQCER